jgi:hypothetical protein
MTDIKYVLNDPTTPDLIIPMPLPAKPQVMDFRVEGYIGAVDSLWTAESQAANAYCTLCNCIQRVINHAPNVNHWAATQTLYVQPRAGVQFNAYYDRSGLRFFYAKDPVMNKVVYAADSRDVVAHELGHAILDAYRPDLYNVQAMEIWAFHEGWADVHSILDSLHYDAVIDRLVGVNLRQSNFATRLAEEMGRAIYDLTRGRMGHSATALRDAVNQFMYTEPERLPTQGRDDQLLSEPHSFGRVWLGAWWDLFCSIYSIEMETTDLRTALVNTRDILFKYSLDSLSLAPATVRFYDAMARAMLVVDKANGYKYNGVMNQVFLNRGILKTSFRPLLAMNWEMTKPMLSGDNVIMEKANVVAVRKKNIDIMSLPQHMLNVEVPNDSYYEFNGSGDCVDVIISSASEQIDHANVCVEFLKANDMIRPDKATPFEITNEGKLVRSHFACECGFNNSVLPGAPEFGKPWKSDNNSGCCTSCKKCKKTRRRPAKIGCYITYTASNGATVVRSGQTRSIQVC